MASHHQQEYQGGLQMASTEHNGMQQPMHFAAPGGHMYTPLHMMPAYHAAPITVRYGAPGPGVQLGVQVSGVVPAPESMDMFGGRLGLPMMTPGQPGVVPGGAMMPGSQPPHGTMMLAHPGTPGGEPVHYYISQPMGVMPAFGLQPMAGQHPDLKLGNAVAPHGAGGPRRAPGSSGHVGLAVPPPPPPPSAPSHNGSQGGVGRSLGVTRGPQQGNSSVSTATGQPKRQVPRGLEENVKRTIYVSYVDVSVTEEELATFFSQCGQVMDCRICGDPNSAMRFAFLEFADVQAAQLALAQTGAVLGGWPLKVQPSKTAIVPVSKDLMPRSQDEVIRCSKTVYVASIDKHVERGDVRAFFEQLCGPVARLRLLGDSSHQTRIAFVEFVAAEGAKAALNCSGALLGSMPVRVSPSKTPIRADVRSHKNHRDRQARQQQQQEGRGGSGRGQSAADGTGDAVPSESGDVVAVGGGTGENGTDDQSAALPDTLQPRDGATGTAIEPHALPVAPIASAVERTAGPGVEENGGASLANSNGTLEVSSPAVDVAAEAAAAEEVAGGLQGLNVQESA